MKYSQSSFSKNESNQSNSSKYDKLLHPADTLLTFTLQFYQLEAKQAQSKEFLDKNLTFKNTIIKYLINMIEKVSSISFKYFNDEVMDDKQMKNYASKNILQNIIYLTGKIHSFIKQQIKNNQVKSQQIIREVNQFILLEIEEIISQLISKYPIIPPTGVSPELIKTIKPIDFRKDYKLDFLLLNFKQNWFVKSQLPNLKKNIMRTINKMISLSFQNIDKNSSQTYYDRFQKFNKNLLWIATQQNVSETSIKSFKQKISKFLLNPSDLDPLKELFKNGNNDQLKNLRQADIKEFVQAKKILYNVKLTKSVVEFQNKYIQNEDLKIQHSAILRVIVKWIQDLQDIFMKSQNLILENGYQFKNHQNKPITLTLDQKKILHQLLSKKWTSIQQIFEKQKQNCNKLLSIFLQDEYIETSQYLFEKSLSFSANINEFFIKQTIQRLIYLIKELQNITQDAGIQQQRINIQRNKQKKKNKKQQKEEEVGEQSSQHAVELKDVCLVANRLGDQMRGTYYCKEEQFMNVLNIMYQLDLYCREQGNNFFQLVRIKNKIKSQNNNALINYMFLGQIQCELQLFLDSASDKQKQKIKKNNVMSHFLYELTRGQFGVVAQLTTIVNQNDPINVRNKSASLSFKRYVQKDKLYEIIPFYENKLRNKEIQQILHRDSIYRCANLYCSQFNIYDRLNLLTSKEGYLFCIRCYQIKQSSPKNLLLDLHSLDDWIKRILKNQYIVEQFKFDSLLKSHNKQIVLVIQPTQKKVSTQFFLIFQSEINSCLVIKSLQNKKSAKKFDQQQYKNDYKENKYYYRIVSKMQFSKYITKQKIGQIQKIHEVESLLESLQQWTQNSSLHHYLDKAANNKIFQQQQTKLSTIKSSINKYLQGKLTKYFQEKLAKYLQEVQTQQFYSKMTQQIKAKLIQQIKARIAKQLKQTHYYYKQKMRLKILRKYLRQKSLNNFIYISNLELNTQFLRENLINSNPNLILSKRDEIGSKLIEQLKKNYHSQVYKFQSQSTYFQNIHLLQINKFTHLKKLNLINNNIQKIITIEFQDLQELYLNQNKIKILTIRQSFKLRRLQISENQLTYFQYDRLQRLQRLVLNKNKLEQILLPNLYELKYLDVNANRLQKLCLNDSSKLTKLLCNKSSLAQKRIINLNITLHSQVKLEELMLFRYNVGNQIKRYNCQKLKKCTFSFSQTQQQPSLQQQNFFSFIPQLQYLQYGYFHFNVRSSKNTSFSILDARWKSYKTLSKIQIFLQDFGENDAQIKLKQFQQLRFVRLLKLQDQSIKNEKARLYLPQKLETLYVSRYTKKKEYHGDVKKTCNFVKNICEIQLSNFPSKLVNIQLKKARMSYNKNIQKCKILQSNQKDIFIEKENKIIMIKNNSLQILTLQCIQSQPSPAQSIQIVDNIMLQKVSVIWPINDIFINSCPKLQSVYIQQKDVRQLRLDLSQSQKLSSFTLKANKIKQLNIQLSTQNKKYEKIDFSCAEQVQNQKLNLKNTSNYEFGQAVLSNKTDHFFIQKFFKGSIINQLSFKIHSDNYVFKQQKLSKNIHHFQFDTIVPPQSKTFKNLTIKITNLAKPCKYHQKQQKSKEDQQLGFLSSVEAKKSKTNKQDKSLSTESNSKQENKVENRDVFTVMTLPLNVQLIKIIIYNTNNMFIYQPGQAKVATAFKSKVALLNIMENILKFIQQFLKEKQEKITYLKKQQEASLDKDASKYIEQLIQKLKNQNYSKQVINFLQIKENESSKQLFQQTLKEIQKEVDQAISTQIKALRQRSKAFQSQSKGIRYCIEKLQQFAEYRVAMVRLRMQYFQPVNIKDKTN